MRVEVPERLRKAEMLGQEEGEEGEEAKDFRAEDFKLGLNYGAINARLKTHTGHCAGVSEETAGHAEEAGLQAGYLSGEDREKEQAEPREGQSGGHGGAHSET